MGKQMGNVRRVGITNGAMKLLRRCADEDGLLPANQTEAALAKYLEAKGLVFGFGNGYCLSGAGVDALRDADR